MILQVGFALWTIWVLNCCYVAHQIFKHTPNWRDADVDSDQLVQNFLTNTPPERLEFVKNVSSMNRGLFWMGFGLVILALLF